MAVSEVWTLYAINTGSGLIDGIDDFRLDKNISEVLNSADGDVDPTFTASLGEAPVATVSTKKIANALGVTGISGLGFTSGVTLALRQRDENALLKSGSNHLTITPDDGLIVPTRLQGSQGEEASIELAVHVSAGTGTTNPLTIAASAALSGSPALDEKFTIGAVSLNGTTLGGVQSIDVDFGLEVVAMGGDGDPYPTFLFIRKREPLITVEVLQAGYLATVTNDGLAIDVNDASFTFSSIGANAVRSGTDVVLTVDDGYINWPTVGGSQDGDQTLTLTVRPVFDGTNDIIVLTGV